MIFTIHRWKWKSYQRIHQINPPADVSINQTDPNLLDSMLLYLLTKQTIQSLRFRIIKSSKPSLLFNHQPTNTSTSFQNHQQTKPRPKQVCSSIDKSTYQSSDRSTRSKLSLSRSSTEIRLRRQKHRQLAAFVHWSQRENCCFCWIGPFPRRLFFSDNVSMSS